jgi:hypothetical protein
VGTTFATSVHFTHCVLQAASQLSKGKKVCKDVYRSYNEMWVDVGGERQKEK